VKYQLIFDKSDEEIISDKILPLVREIIDGHEVYNADRPTGSKPKGPFLFYLSDSHLKKLLPTLSSSGIILAILPHPDAREACLAMGIGKSLEKSIDHLKTLPEPVSMDILYCNGIPIFNNMVIGQSFRLTTEDSSVHPGLWKRNLIPVTRFFNMQPFRVDIELPQNKKMKTTVSGIVVSEHRKSSLITKLAIEDSSVNDGKMHAFFISPGSAVQMLYYGIRSLWKKRQLPPFAAHVKTDVIKLSFPAGAREYMIDKKTFSAQEIALRVDKHQLEIIPGAYLQLSDTSKESDEIFKLGALPTGEAAQALAERTIPLIKHASSEDFKELFQTLRNNAQLKNSYLVLMVLSTVLATFGLFANSTPVVIGAMILAPLMSPIISLSMGTLRHDKKLIVKSIMTILGGMCLSMLFAVLITWLTPIQSAGSEILARTRPNLLDLGIAVVSGIAGAYAYAREEIAKTLAGVAIAVALIPPLAVASIGIGWADVDVFLGAMLLLGTNLAGIVLAASVTFMLLGFSPLKLASRGIMISLFSVLVLSIPLALGFNQMVYEHKIKQQLEELKTDVVTIRDVHVLSLNPMKLSLKLVSKSAISDDEVDRVKALVENKLQRSAEIEMVMAVSR
jgi:uncharacterized hydrophobic protein (TIGR00271 family)